MNNERVTADINTLLAQATSTATGYMNDAETEIDKQFGAGFARENPVLIAAFMQAATADFTCAATLKVIGSALDGISQSMQSIVTAIELSD